MSLLNRISFVSIITKHLGTLYDSRDGAELNKNKIPASDFIVFFIIPIAVAVSLVVLKVFISETYVNILLTLLSIFAGLLFGLLPLVFQQGKDLAKDVNNDLGEVEKSIQAISNMEEYREALEAQCNSFIATHVENVKKCQDSINSLNDMIAFLKSKSTFFSTEPQLLKVKAKINEELFRNICFAILVAIFSIIAILCSQIEFSFCVSLSLSCFFQGLINFISYFFLGVFLTTLLMILKRFFLLY